MESSEGYWLFRCDDVLDAVIELDMRMFSAFGKHVETDQFIKAISTTVNSFREPLQHISEAIGKLFNPTPVIPPHVRKAEEKRQRREALHREHVHVEIRGMKPLSTIFDEMMQDMEPLPMKIPPVPPWTPKKPKHIKTSKANGR